MDLNRELDRQGHFLFRWRSYLPVVVFIPVIFSELDMTWPLGSHRLHQFWEVFCLMVALAGLGIRCLVIGHAPQGTSGRNTSEQIAEVVNTTGMYSLVRHPLYLGNFLIGLGPCLLPMVWWLPLLYALAFALYYERIMIAEEGFLRAKFGAEMDAWIAETPAFFPKLTGWKAPALPFSFRNVLRREYTAAAQVALIFFGLEILEHVVVDHRLVLEPAWIAVATVGGAQYVILRAIKRNTDWLQVSGR